MTDDLVYAQSCHLYSLHERANAIMRSGTVSRQNTVRGMTKPLACLSRAQLEKELGARGIYEGRTKKYLEHLLAEKMHEIQRLPALLVNNPQTPLKDLCLNQYEILLVEPLHDISHHIENVLIELPHHLNSKEKKIIEETVTTCMQGKDNKRGCDHRLALIQTTAYLQQKALVSEAPLKVLQTLTELQRVLYCSEEARCPQLVLRYYNQSWYHAMLLKQLIDCGEMKK